MLKKQFKSLIGSQIFSALAVTVCMLIDGMLTSRYLGEDAMAAYGISSAVILFVVAIGGTIAAGAQIMCSKALGNGNTEETCAAFSTAAMAGLIISAFTTALVIAFADRIAVVLGAVTGSNVQQLTKNYLIGYIIGCPGFIGVQICNPFLQLAGKKKTVLQAIGIMIAVNVAADLLNVFVFRGGILGMGLASSLSYFSAFVLALCYFLKDRSVFVFRLKSVGKSTFKTILFLGNTYAVYQLCRALYKITLNNIFMKRGDTELVAIYSVLHTIYEICSAGGMGIAATTLTLSGLLYGKKDRKGLDSLVGLSVRFSVIIGSAIAVFCIVFARPIISLFLKGNAQLADSCVSGLRILILAIIPFSINASMRSYCQGIHKTFLSQTICIAQNYVLGVAAVLVASRFFVNDQMMWVAIVTGEVLTIVFTFAIFSIRNKHPAVHFADYNVAEDIQTSAPPEAEFMIRNRNDVMTASEALQNLCGEQDKRNGMILALCVEELAMNTLKYGTSGKRNVQIEVVLKREANSWICTITDDAYQFDPTRYYDLYKNTNSTDHIGIRMVHNLAGKISYINLLGMNCVTIQMEDQNAYRN